MFWVFKLSFVVDILAIFDLATFWAILLKIWQFFIIIWSPIQDYYVREYFIWEKFVAPG
jgi:hypothetical protein